MFWPLRAAFQAGCAHLDLLLTCRFIHFRLTFLQQSLSTRLQRCASYLCLCLVLSLSLCVTILFAGIAPPFHLYPVVRALMQARCLTSSGSCLFTHVSLCMLICIFPAIAIQSRCAASLIHCPHHTLVLFQALKDTPWSILGTVPHSPLMPGSMAMMDEGYIGAAGSTLVAEQWACYRLDIICAASCQWNENPITAAKLGSVRPPLRGWQKEETGVIDRQEKMVRYVWLLHCLLTETWIGSCNERALNHDLCILWTLMLGLQAFSTI